MPEQTASPLAPPQDPPFTVGVARRPDEPDGPKTAADMASEYIKANKIDPREFAEWVVKQRIPRSDTDNDTRLLTRLQEFVAQRINLAAAAQKTETAAPAAEKTHPSNDARGQAQQPGSPTQGSSADTQRAEKPSQEMPRQAQAQPTDPQKPERPAQESPQILREVGEKLLQAAAGLADKSLAQRAESIAQQINDNVAIYTKRFQHNLAYTVQDVEKARGTPIPLSEAARAEITRLAGSAPGLENERMLALMRSTAKIGDPSVVAYIRRAGAEIGQQANQNTATTTSRIETLENKARVAARYPSPDEAVNGAAPNRPAHDAQPNRGGPGDQTTPAGQNPGPRQNSSGARQQFGPPIIIESNPVGDVIKTGAEIVNGVFRAIRGSGPANTPPWEAGAQPFGDRLKAFEANLQRGRDEASLRSAEASGRAALDALEGFRTGEGAVVMNRIREAARNDPNGMAGVLSEMRAGGKYADLRQQFNVGLNDERGASAAYDKAASALARYGQDRQAVEQVIARRPDAANLSAKFEAMDAQIGSAAGELPSRRDGKTMLEDMSKQVADMLQKAMQGIKTLFTRGATQSASASGPSPG